MDKAHTDGNGIAQTNFEATFARPNVTIIVGDRPGAGKSYETTADGKNLYLNLTVVNGSAMNLQNKLIAAAMAMNTPKAEIG